MTHGIEKHTMQRLLQESIIAVIRDNLVCTRISGIVRIDASDSTAFDVPLSFPEPSFDHLAFPSLALGLVDHSAASSAAATSGASSRADSPASSSPAAKVNRRKAYQPKRFSPEGDSDAYQPLDPHVLQASFNEAMAPSMAVFPTPTTERIVPWKPPSLINALAPPPSLLAASNKPNSARPRSRAIRPKVPGGRANGGAGGSSGSSSSSALKRNPTKEFTCNQCQDRFRSLSSLTEHTTSVHQCFRCTTCNAKFTQRSNLQRHSLKHLGFKPFKCAICRKEYYRKDHLVRHVEVSHPGSDPKGSIVNVLPSSECLRLAELERQMQLAAALAAEKAMETEEIRPPSAEAAVDLSMNGQSSFMDNGDDVDHDVTPIFVSAASSEPSNATLDEDEEVGGLMMAEEEDDEDEEGEAPTDLSLRAPLMSRCLPPTLCSSPLARD